MTEKSWEQTDPFQPRERHLVVVSGGTSEGSTSTMLARDLEQATTDELSRLGIVPRVHLVEIRNLATQLAQSTVTMARSPEVDAAIKATEHADGVIAVTPTYQASYSGIFKTFWDLVDKDAMNGVPVLLGATGGSPRHSLVIDHAMRPLFSYLNMLINPTAVFAANEDWGFGDTSPANPSLGNDGKTWADLAINNAESQDTAEPSKGYAGDYTSLEKRIERAGKEFGELLETLTPRNQERAAEPESPLEVTPFAQLLGGH